MLIGLFVKFTNTSADIHKNILIYLINFSLTISSNLRSIYIWSKLKLDSSYKKYILLRIGLNSQSLLAEFFLKILYLFCKNLYILNDFNY